MTQKLVSDLKSGDVIKDDIYAQVQSVVSNGYDECAVFVEDGNGYFYAIRMWDNASVTVYDWSEEDWKAYREL